MKRFEICYNGKPTKVAVKDGMITIHLFNHNGYGDILSDGESCMYIDGVDYEKNRRIVWYDNSPIKIGDKFKIKLTEIDVPSVPAKITEDKNIKRPKTKLAFSHELEATLKKQGLI